MKKLLIDNYKTILKIFFYGFIIYWVLSVLTPNLQSNKDYINKIDSLNIQIKKFEEKNLKLDSQIMVFNNQIVMIDSTISKIKQEKTIIKEYYHEKIINVDTFGRGQLNDFFTKRYKK